MAKRRLSSLQTAQKRRTFVHKKLLKAQARVRKAVSLQTKSGRKFGGTFIPFGLVRKGASKSLNVAERNRAQYLKEARTLDKKIKGLGGKLRYRSR